MVRGPNQQAFIGELMGFRSGPSGFAETGGREASRPKPLTQSSEASMQAPAVLEPSVISPAQLAVGLGFSVGALWSLPSLICALMIAACQGHLCPY